MAESEKDKAARAKLGRIGGSLTAEQVATMPIATVYELLGDFEKGLWPLKTGPKL